jgi:hypothetical protein
MKIRYSGPKLLAFLSLLVFSSLGFAQVTVGCPGGTPGAFTSLESAILSSPDNSTFLVSGTCTEFIAIQNRSNLNFFGNPSATIQAFDPSAEVLLISNSRSITFNNTFVLNGGLGVVIANTTNASFNGVTVQNSGQFGITSSNSVTHMTSSSVTASTRTGVVVNGGSFSLDGGDSISNNGRLGISAGTAHLILEDGSGPNLISHNGIAGIQIFGASQGDFTGDNEITNNAGGFFGLSVSNSSGVTITGGLINSNIGTGVICSGTAHCEFSGTHVDSNSLGGIQIIQHSDASFDGTVEVSGNTGTGVLVDQVSALTSNGGNTIANNTGDGLILNTLSGLNFLGVDTITATAGNLALNCNNGSMVEGDVSTYKPKRCGAQFQAVPVH